MTRPTKFIGSVPMLGGPLGFAPEDVEPEIPPPIDRALGSNNFNGAVFTVNAPSSGGIVQTKSIDFRPTTDGSYNVNFDSTPTNGNTMFALLFSTAGIAVDSSGWTSTQTGTANGDQVILYRRIAGAAEPTAVHVNVFGIAGTSRLQLYEIAGSYSTSGSETDQPRTDPLTAAAITPGSVPAIVVAGFIGQVATYAGDPTWTPTNGLTTDSFDRQNPGRLVGGAYNKTLTVAGSFTPTVNTTSLYAGTETANVDFTATATPTDPVWNVDASAVADGNDSTYQEIDGPDVLRIDLGTAYTIISTRLLAGSATAQQVTYSIIGANEADFSDGVTLGTTTYTSTGSFTADDETWSWHTDTAYRYFELDGTDENRRVYTWSLYEADITEGQDHTHDDLQDQIDNIAEAINPLFPLSTNTPTDGDVWTWGGAEWAPQQNVRRITSNGSNTITGPFVNFASGNGIALAASSNTVTISNTGGGVGGSLTDHTHAVTGSGSTGGGATLNVPTLNATGLFRTSGVITSTINSDQNNFAPTGIHTNAIIYFDSLTATRTITGIDAGSEGEFLILQNNTNQSLALAFESGSSTAANRFRTPNAATHTIRQRGGALLVYIQGRWCVMQA